MHLQDQYIEFTSALPSTSAVFGLGERTPSYGMQLQRNPLVPLALWNRDNPAADPDENIYGSHPNYLEIREGVLQRCMDQIAVSSVFLSSGKHIAAEMQAVLLVDCSTSSVVQASGLITDSQGSSLCRHGFSALSSTLTCAVVDPRVHIVYNAAKSCCRLLATQNPASHQRSCDCSHQTGLHTAWCS